MKKFPITVDYVMYFYDPCREGFFNIWNDPLPAKEVLSGN